MLTLSSTIKQHLDRAIAQLSPQTIVELSATPLFRDATNTTYRHYDMSGITSTEDQNRPAIAAADLAIVVDAPCYLSRVGVEQLLSSLRHTGTRAILAINTANTEQHREAWRDRDFLALGFRRTEGSRRAAPDHQIYYYDIHDYKLTPSWLNARHWANPNRWDAERW